MRQPGEPVVIRYDEVPCPNPALEGPCHIFKGAKYGNGYGAIGIARKTRLVHRYVWEQANGPIPKGLMIDHMCRTRACCNVLHLRVVTAKVNATENTSKQYPATHCPAGHEYTPENTFRTKRGYGICLTCRRKRDFGRKRPGKSK